MTTATITISDGADETINMEGRLDNNDAINEPPTGALVVSTYIAANAEAICKEAFRWFHAQQPKERVPQILLSEGAQ